MEQLALSLDVNVSGIWGEVEAALEFSTDREYNRFLVTLNQSYFTMAYELPISYEEVFDTSVTPEDLAGYIGEGNPAAYISSITYGRTFYMLIESTSSKQDMEASIEASFGAAIADVELGSEVTYVNKLFNVKTKAYALGGEAGPALSAVLGGLDDLKTYLEEGGSITSGVPLSYNVRALSNNQLVETAVAVDYDMVDCEPVINSEEGGLLWFRADSLVTDSAGLVSEWGNSFGNNVNAVRGNLTGGPHLILSAINNLPAIRFYGNKERMIYDPARLLNTSFTVFAVVKMMAEPNQGGYFMYGDGCPEQHETMVAGYANDQEIRFSQQVGSGTSDPGDEYGLVVTSRNVTNAFELWTMRFSKVEGIALWKNGALLKENRALTAPLTAYKHAAIGLIVNTDSNVSCEWRPSVILQCDIAEILAYTKDLEPQAREVVEERLIEKYDLFNQ